MSDSNSATTCNLCGRLVVPGQAWCPCGARLAIRPATAEDKKPRRNLSLALAVAPLIGATAFVWYLWGSGAPAASAPILKILLVTFIACAALAMLEVSRLMDDWDTLRPDDEPPWPPVAWFAFMLFAWPTAFPFYAWKLLRPASAKLFAVGLLSWILFLAGFVMLQSRANAAARPPDKAATSEPQPAASATTPAPATTSTAAVAAPGPTPAASTSAPAPPPAAPTPYVNPPAYVIEARKTPAQPSWVRTAATPVARLTPSTKTGRQEESAYGVSIPRKNGGR